MHGGLRVARFGGDAATEGAAYGPLSGYSFQGDDDWGLGYVVGVAYEIPEKALRIALTYGSAIDFELDSTETFPDAVGGQVVEGTTEISMPQSVNLDFQTGIAPKTLLFGLDALDELRGLGGARPGLAENFDAILASKDYNIWTYKLGVGRQFTKHWAGAVHALYEPASTRRSARSTRPTAPSASASAPATPPTRASRSPAASSTAGSATRTSRVPSPAPSSRDNDALGLGLSITAPF